METAPLKSFATWARRELITQVSARLTAVLAPSSPERVENQRAVATLERDIAAAGGGAKGKDAIADKVAYTWFNRIIALRFMDANGYTGIGVVSPAHGQQVGQPEILADAKRGSIDPAVITNKRTLDTITGLLDGTRPSADAQGEAYTLLLAEYCRYWNRSMPFMFEREGDYTELLIPANLLAADSILARAAAALTEEVCREVEVIGWLYQFYISERKDEVFAGFKKGKKAGAAEIPAATQLFTPHWIVRYLVENSVGRLWMLNHPESRLVDQMDYYIEPVDDESDFLKITRPEELTVMDPACGSGHMLTYAFDLLYAIYEEEGYAPSEIPELILTHNLFGTEIDQRAGALAAFVLVMKARARQRVFLNKQIEPQICVLEPIAFNADDVEVIDPMKPGVAPASRGASAEFWSAFEKADTFGSLIRVDPDELEEHYSALEYRDRATGGTSLFEGELDDRLRLFYKQAKYLASYYAVVVANPPYMGSNQMSALLSQFMRSKLPDSKQDLYGAFVVRGIELANRGGLLAIVIGDTWMSIQSFRDLRLRLLDGHSFDSFVHMHDVSNHPDIFGANSAFVLSMSGNRSKHAPFIRLTPLGQEGKAADLRAALLERTRESGFHRASGEDFAAIPGSPIVYWLSEKMRAAFSMGKPLSEVSTPLVGLRTGDNNRFMRRWWEVALDRSAFDCGSLEAAATSGARWFPYNKGGAFRRWYGNQEFVVNWEHDGKEIEEGLAERYPYLVPSDKALVRGQGRDRYFSPSVSWSKISSGAPAFRAYPRGFIFDVAGTSMFADTQRERDALIAFTNSQVAYEQLSAVAPTMNFEVGQVAGLPVVDEVPDETVERVAALVEQSKDDWDTFETSWNFAHSPLVMTARRTARGQTSPVDWN